MANQEPTWAIVADYATRLDEAEKAAAAERQWWLGFLALLPYTVPGARKPFIPAQRQPPQETAGQYQPRSGRPADLWPPPRANRFIDRRAKGHL